MCVCGGVYASSTGTSALRAHPTSERAKRGEMERRTSLAIYGSVGIPPHYTLLQCIPILRTFRSYHMITDGEGGFVQLVFNDRRNIVYSSIPTAWSIHRKGEQKPMNHYFNFSAMRRWWILPRCRPNVRDGVKWIMCVCVCDCAQSRFRPFGGEITDEMSEIPEGRISQLSPLLSKTHTHTFSIVSPIVSRTHSVKSFLLFSFHVFI